MRVHGIKTLLLVSILAGWDLALYAAPKGPVEDPYKLLAKAAPFYDFSSPDLKPWHLKASYQLYDQNGKPGEQGTFEYWWASPKVYRISWTRGAVHHTEWHEAGGKIAEQYSGPRLDYFEDHLIEDLLDPLPKVRADQGRGKTKSTLSLKSLKNGKTEIQCVVNGDLRWSEADHPIQQQVFVGSILCFDPLSSALIYQNTIGTITTLYGDIKNVDGRLLPFSVTTRVGQRNIMSANVTEVSNLNPNDPVFELPSKDSLEKVLRVRMPNTDVKGGIIVRVFPHYPSAAKSNGVQGVVLLRGEIGLDGNVHELQVVASPSPLLSSSAMESVSRWKYKPYLLNGDPVTVETDFTVAFQIGPEPE